MDSSLFIFLLFALSAILAAFLYLTISSNNEKTKELESLKENHEKLSKYSKELRDKYDTLEKETGELTKLKKERSDIENEIKELQAQTIIESYNFSDYDGISSEECKNKISVLKVREQDLIRNGNAVTFLSTPGKGEKKLYSNNEKQILRCFNSDCDNIFLSVSVKNIDVMRGKIQKSFETLNKIFETDGVQLSTKLLEIKLKELSWAFTSENRKEREREEQKAIKEQMLEEEKVRREIEREKAKLDKEEHQFKNEISKLMGYLQKASDIEKQLYIDKIKELEEKLKLLEKDKENVLQREQNTRAGFVYVISNIGSFGEDVYKIGMTRRLEPMDRVKELGDASVPFEFDVHAMIFSEDAPNLENILHETFRKYQVNKVNNRKEFFKVPLDEIEKVVKENHNATVTFTRLAKAEQYRESLRLAEAAV